MSVCLVIFEAYKSMLITMSKYQQALIIAAIQCPVVNNKANDCGQRKTLYFLNVLFLIRFLVKMKKNRMIEFA